MLINKKIKLSNKYLYEGRSRILFLNTRCLRELYNVDLKRNTKNSFWEDHVSCFWTPLVWGKCPFGAMLTSTTLLTYTCKQTRIKLISNPLLREVKWNNQLSDDSLKLSAVVNIWMVHHKVFEEWIKFWESNQFQTFAKKEAKRSCSQKESKEKLSLIRLHLTLTAGAAAKYKSLLPRCIKTWRRRTTSKPIHYWRKINSSAPIH